MPGWLLWTLVGLGAWFAASVPLAFLAGYLLSRRAAPPPACRAPGRTRIDALTRSSPSPDADQIGPANEHAVYNAAADPRVRSALARGRPEVDVRLGGVLVDLRKLVVGEVELV